MNGPVNGGRFPYAVDPGEAETDPPKVRPKSLRRLFAQGKHWRRADGTWVRVRDMHPAHRANAARMLLRKATEYAQAVSMATLHMPLDSSDDVLDALAQDTARTADPEAWMRSTKLYRRLVKGLPTVDDDVNAPGYEVKDTRKLVPDDGMCCYHGYGGGIGCPDCPKDGARREAFRAVLAVFEQRTKRGGDLWSRALRQEDVPAMVAEAARQIGVTL